MEKTIIEVPTELLQAARLSPDEARTELALRLYRTNRLTFEQAKELAGSNGADVIQQLWEKDQQFNLNDFLSWASHDLKTPLNAIIGFSKVVLKGIDGPVNEMQVTDLTSVHNNGQRMLTLLSNLVDMARINNGEVKLVTAEVEFDKFVTETANRWKNQNAGKELSVEANLLAPKTLLDSSRMRQAVQSLLTYASLYIENGGSISLVAQDDAAGFNVTIQSHGQKPRDKSAMDTAMLGFIARSLVELHGGRMEMLQEMEEGAMILFSIPRQA